MQNLFLHPVHTKIIISANAIINKVQYIINNFKFLKSQYWGNKRMTMHGIIVPIISKVVYSESSDFGINKVNLPAFKCTHSRFF